jgi:hypothetical protein
VRVFHDRSDGDGEGVAATREALTGTLNGLGVYPEFFGSAFG